MPQTDSNTSNLQNHVIFMSGLKKQATDLEEILFINTNKLCYLCVILKFLILQRLCLFHLLKLPFIFRSRAPKTLEEPPNMFHQRTWHAKKREAEKRTKRRSSQEAKEIRVLQHDVLSSRL